jgi:hypothetical protein
VRKWQSNRFTLNCFTPERRNALPAPCRARRLGFFPLARTPRHASVRRSVRRSGNTLCVTSVGPHCQATRCVPTVWTAAPPPTIGQSRPHVVAAPLPMPRLVLPSLALVRKLPCSPTRSLAIKRLTTSVTRVAEPPSRYYRRHRCSRQAPLSGRLHRKHMLLLPSSCTSKGPTLACWPGRAASSPE